MSIESFNVTVADVRMAFPGTIGDVFQKLRQHAQLQATDSKLLWLAEESQRLEIEQTLGPEIPSEERIYSAVGGSRPVADLLRRLEGDLPVGTSVAVVSYDRYVTSAAEHWRGSIRVRGLPMVAFRTSPQQWPAMPLLANRFSADTIQQVLSALVRYLERNSVRPPKSINLAEVIPAARLDLPFLKSMVTTGLSSAVLRAGVSQGLLTTVGQKELALAVPMAVGSTAQSEPSDVAAESCSSSPREELVSADSTTVPSREPTIASRPAETLTASAQPDRAAPLGGVEPVCDCATQPPAVRRKPSDWSNGLAEARVDMDPRAVPLMCRALEALVDPNGTIKGGSVTVYHLKVTLQRSLAQERISQFVPAARKIARAFVNRLAYSGSLLDAKGRPWQGPMASSEIVAIEKGFASLMLEYLLVLISEYQMRGGKPLRASDSTLDRLARFLLSDSKPENVEAIEAAIERLARKGRLLKDGHGTLTVPGPRASGEASGSAA